MKSVLDTTVTAISATSAKDILTGTLRFAADKVWNPRSKHKVAVINSETLTVLASYRYASGGDVDFRSKDEVAALIGVDEVITSDLVMRQHNIISP